jgi:hypothetical protein
MGFLHMQYWEKAEFPFHAIPKLATLGLAGGTTKVYKILNHLVLMFYI